MEYGCLRVGCWDMLSTLVSIAQGFFNSVLQRQRASCGPRRRESRFVELGTGDSYVVVIGNTSGGRKWRSDLLT
jgi:hypothetical protein